MLRRGRSGSDAEIRAEALRRDARIGFKFSLDAPDGVSERGIFSRGKRVPDLAGSTVIFYWPNFHRAGVVGDRLGRKIRSGDRRHYVTHLCDLRHVHRKNCGHQGESEKAHRRFGQREERLPRRLVGVPRNGQSVRRAPRRDKALRPLPSAHGLGLRRLHASRLLLKYRPSGHLFGGPRDRPPQSRGDGPDRRRRRRRQRAVTPARPAHELLGIHHLGNSTIFSRRRRHPVRLGRTRNLSSENFATRKAETTTRPETE
mmetsp:Transcript_291/g.1080  ORF Transcript_291/g.1080 Transcript_291/m.1080 type:complete len:258 (+) Transcript_291:473-1246(+)